MATLGDLKQRIIAETLRDDLADDLADQLTLIIQKSVDQYAANRWWFNERGTLVNCVIGSEFVALPDDFRFLDQADLKVGGIFYTLSSLQPVEVDDLYNAGPIGGQPTAAAILGTNLYVWPTPNVAYPIHLRYVADVLPALDYADDASANFWTNQGQDLITARAKLRLYRDYLSATVQDTRFLNATAQEQEAYSRLRSEHNRRLTTNRVRAGW